MFTKASKRKQKARIALLGPTGSGKTYTALQIAAAFGDKIAVIDTEHGAASLYSDVVPFDTVNLERCGPGDYIAAMDAAAEAGYDTVIIDSLSHEWVGRGGCLEQAEGAGGTGSDGRSFFSWKGITPKHNACIDRILTLPCHVIATMRTKTGYAIQTNERGKPMPVNVGLEPVQRDGVEYEFGIVGLLDREHGLTISKSRMSSIDGSVFEKPGKEFGTAVLEWLNEGQEVKPGQRLATKEELDDLKKFATSKGWTDDQLREYTLESFAFEGVTRQNFLKTFTVDMLHNTKEAIEDWVNVQQDADAVFAEGDLEL